MSETRVDLSRHEADALREFALYRLESFDRPFSYPWRRASMEKLEIRGLVERGFMISSEGTPAWIITAAGRAWLKAEAYPSAQAAEDAIGLGVSGDERDG